MTDATWERWSRGMGVVFAVLALAAFLIFGEAPKIEDSPEEVASFYQDDGGRVLTALTIFAFAFIPLFWFVGAIANALRSAGEGRLAATAIAAVAAWAAAQFVFGASAAPLAVVVAERADPDVSYALHALGLCIDNISAFALAAAILAASVGLARARLLPAWFTWFGAVAALLVALHGTNWADEGFWSPGGGYVYVVVIVGLLWIVATSVLLFRAPVTPDPSARASVAAT
ncbi:MAG: hypothetical protein ICV59_01060 [Thermoleophilia bacterium]|nr:hypothetical protein [Thermoleophilia bacterium]